MTNGETAAAWRYHDETKHSPESVRESGHTMDFSNRVLPYKI